MNPFASKSSNPERRALHAEKKQKSRAAWNALEVVVVNPKPIPKVNDMPIRGLVLHVTGSANNALLAVSFNRNDPKVKEFTNDTGIANWRFAKPDPQDSSKPKYFSPDGTRELKEEQCILVLPFDLDRQVTVDSVKQWVNGTFLPNFEKHLSTYGRDGKKESIVVPDTANWITFVDTWTEAITQGGLVYLWRYGIEGCALAPEGVKSLEALMKKSKNYLYSCFKPGEVPVSFITEYKLGEIHLLPEDWSNYQLHLHARTPEHFRPNTTKADSNMAPKALNMSQEDTEEKKFGDPKDKGNGTDANGFSTGTRSPPGAIVKASELESDPIASSSADADTDSE